jgi:hypothetical protein
MERAKNCITILSTANYLTCPQPRLQNRLMNLRLIISHALIIIFFALISYGLTGSIAVKSTMGVILAIISLGATIVFLWLLPRLYEQPTEEESSSES